MQTLSEWIDEQKRERRILLEYVRLFGRPGSDFGPDASHFQILLTYWPNGSNEQKHEFIFEYSMGSAHKRGPTLADCISSLLCDASYGEYSFDEFLEESCAEIHSAADYHKHEAAWRSCVETRAKLREVFPAEVFEMENDI